MQHNNLDFDKDIRDASSVIEINPTAYNYMIRAKIYKSQQKLDEAFSDYLTAAMMNELPLSAEAYYYCFEICFQQKKFNKGMIYFLQGKELNPNIGEMFENHELLIDEVTTCINKRWFKNIEDYIKRGCIYLVKNMYEEAEKDAKTAHEINTPIKIGSYETGPNYAYLKIHIFYGNIHFANKQYDHAIRHYEYALFMPKEIKLLALKQTSYAYFMLGFAQQKQGDLGNAITSFHKALYFDNQFALAKQQLELLLLNIKRGDNLNDISKEKLIEAIKLLPEDKQKQLVELNLGREQTPIDDILKKKYESSSCLLSNSIYKNETEKKKEEKLEENKMTNETFFDL